MVNSSKDKKGNSKSPVQPNATPPKLNDPSIDSKPDEGKPEAGEPLAPPPRPAAAGDYFSTQHPLQLEKNPFESSFATGGSSGSRPAQTPGGTTLPGITSLTSPALPGTGLTPGFWADGLRTGPLSPAMLSGPASGKDSSDYFSERHFTTGVTPNESSIRSGLTPGGGGSMFPQPSPNSQALFEQLASGGATPSTIDFHRTALAAAAANKRDQSQNPLNITSQPQVAQSLDPKPSITGQFDQHDANDAANGLFLLAQARNPPSQQTNHYAPVPQMSVHAHPQQSMQMNSNHTSPHMAHRNGGSISTNSGRGVSEMSAGSDEQEPSSRPNTRGKGKRGAQSQANGRRKADETPSKAPASKKLKMEEAEPSDNEEEPDLSKDEYNAQGKKMTDEEKRKNFLERNRVAALKCRQRKKQWLANLQQKVEIFSSENDSLSAQISQLREEVVNLKTLLLAHKDCPVSHQQGLHGIGMEQLIQGAGYPPQISMNNPYNMAGMQAQVMAGANMQGRRYS